MNNLHRHAYWVHRKKKSSVQVSGWLYLPACRCSRCGYEVNSEKKICPSCGALMDLSAPKEILYRQLKLPL